MAGAGELMQSVLDYMASVDKRSEDYYVPPFTFNPDGSKKYAPDYKEANNLDKLKFKWFFKAVNYDKEICEAVLHPDAHLIRLHILETPLADLMISSKLKEMYMLANWNNNAANE